MPHEQKQIEVTKLDKLECPEVIERPTRKVISTNRSTDKLAYDVALGKTLSLVESQKLLESWQDMFI